MDGTEKALTIIVVGTFLMMAFGVYSTEQTKQACFAAAGSNPEAIKACR